MDVVSRGRLAKFTHESKFISGINTKRIASMAILEGERQRAELQGKRILEVREPSHDWFLANSFRL